MANPKYQTTKQTKQGYASSSRSRSFAVARTFLVGSTTLLVQLALWLLLTRGRKTVVRLPKDSEDGRWKRQSFDQKAERENMRLHARDWILNVSSKSRFQALFTGFAWSGCEEEVGKEATPTSTPSRLVKCSHCMACTWTC